MFFISKFNIFTRSSIINSEHFSSQDWNFPTKPIAFKTEYESRTSAKDCLSKQEII